MEAISILVVEDDTDSRTLLVTVISKMFPQTSVYAAANGKKGLEIFAERSPAVVITDINMPEMNGFQMARHIDLLKRKTCFIALTADTELAHRETDHNNDFRFDRYIVKPVDFPELFDALRQAIGS